MNTRRYFDPLLKTLNQIIYGKEAIIQEILLTFLARGHVLLKDQPGVGKTTLALAFAKALGLDFKRIQFTPDIMPGDITGFSIPDHQTKKFIYHPGIVFCNVLLVDEINRTSPKTQSALLEVMEEGKVTVYGMTRKVPQPFFVIATQNPNQAIGTQKLPEAQIDRFMTECSLGYPDLQAELQLAKAQDSKQKIQNLQPCADIQLIHYAMREIEQIYVSDAIYHYIVRLVRQTRKDARIQIGASPRATLALVRLSQAQAWLEQRDYVIPQDIRIQYPYIMRHRLVPDARIYAQNQSIEDVIQELLELVQVE